MQRPQSQIDFQQLQSKASELARAMEGNYGNSNLVDLSLTSRLQIEKGSRLRCGNEIINSFSEAQLLESYFREVARIEMPFPKPSGNLGNFSKGQGYVQHQGDIIDSLHLSIDSLLERLEDPRRLSPLTSEEEREATKSKILVEYPWLKGLFNRLACIEPATSREWGSSYLAKLDPEQPLHPRMIRRVYAEWPDVIPAGEWKPIPSIEEEQVFRIDNNSFYSRVEAVNYQHDLAAAFNIEAGFLKNSSDSCDHHNKGFYIQHDTQAAVLFKQKVFEAAIIALQRQDHILLRTVKDLESFQANAYVVHRTFSDTGSPLSKVIDRMFSIDILGREWGSPAILLDEHASIRRTEIPWLQISLPGGVAKEISI